MKILVFGDGNKTALAVHSLLGNVFRNYCSHYDDEVILFGYDEKDNKPQLLNNLSAVYIKNPFLKYKFSSYRVRRKFSHIFKIDSRLLSWKYAYKHAKELFNDIDYVIAVAGNFFYVEAAYNFAKERNIKLGLVYFDPFTENIASLNKTKRLKYERKWYDYASFILYKKDLKSIPFDDASKKVKLIEIPIFVKKTTYNPNGHIVYGGTFYKNFRSPDDLNKFIEKSEKSISFDIYTSENSGIIEASNVNVFPLLNSEDYYEKCQQSSAIIVVGNGYESNEVPSKLIEAISFNKPIIALNISDKILSETNYPYIVTSPDSLAQKLKAFKESNIDIFDVYKDHPEKHPDILSKLLKNLITK